MITNGYHPTARCTEAARLYEVWVWLAERYPKHYMKRTEALSKYIAHIQGGCNCRKGLGK